MARNQLRPLFDRVVIKELEPDRMRNSGLLVPPGTNEPTPQHGIVLAVGQGGGWGEDRVEGPAVGADQPAAVGRVVRDASARGRAVADLLAVDEQAHGRAVERACRVVPLAVPHRGRRLGRAYELLGAVADVERE